MDLDDLDAFEYEPRMSDSDALMWSIEKDPLLRSTIVTIYVLDRAPDRSRFTDTMERASRVVPRLRQRVLGHPFSIAPPRWEVDPNFDLRYHLRWMSVAPDDPKPYRTTRGTLRQVFDIAEPIAMQGFDRARPLWEVTVVEGLAGDKAAIIAKIHHSITDGVGGMKLQMEMLDFDRDPEHPGPLLSVPDVQRLTERQRWVDAINYESRRQAGAARGVVASLPERVGRLARDPVHVVTGLIETTSSLARLLRPTTAPMSPLMTERSLSVRFDSLRFPLQPLKDASKIVAGRLNDAFVAAVAGGLRAYHEHHGVDVDDLRMTMPINIRSESNANVAGNQFVPARFAVPAGIDDPIARMNAIRELVAEQRAEPALAMTEPLANLLNRLPATATTAVFGAMLKGIDFITSNVPGAPVPIFVAGALVESQIALGPMTGAATNVVLLSYCDDVNLGVTMDPAAIPDGDAFVECLQDSFEEIIKLGS
jgi:WS/DGAT/MGAT family acyltransferase